MSSQFLKEWRFYTNYLIKSKVEANIKLAERLLDEFDWKLVNIFITAWLNRVRLHSLQEFMKYQLTLPQEDDEIAK